MRAGLGTRALHPCDTNAPDSGTFYVLPGFLKDAAQARILVDAGSVRTWARVLSNRPR